MTRKNDNALLSIGGLSRASGVPVETLRNWERRYGFPVPVRLQSGHRRYPLEVVPRLKQIRLALEDGYKPSFAVPASPEELSKVTGISDYEPLPSNGATSPASPVKEIEIWLEQVARMDATGLESRIRWAWTIYGARQFILSIAVPFLRKVGDRWFNGSFTVAHEHLASETLQSFLVGQWRPLSSRSRGPKVVLANFEGELHSLGIHMAAVFLAMHDMRAVFLGPNTPLDDIVTAARVTGVLAVVIGLAASSDIERSVERLGELKRRLPEELIAAVGGNDDIPPVEGVTTIDDFQEFDEWLVRLSDQR